jgi:hypothetical protein
MSSNARKLAAIAALVGGLSALAVACGADSGTNGEDADGGGAGGDAAGNVNGSDGGGGTNDATVANDASNVADGTTSDGSQQNADGSNGSDATSASDGGADDAASDSGGTDANDGGTTGGGDDAGQDSGMDQGQDAGQDAGQGGGQDAGQDAGPPGYMYIGRFDTNDVVGPRMAWPGTAVVAQFDGTAASVKLTQTDGFSGGPSYFNVIVDGVVGTPFSVTGTSQTYSLVTGLAAGTHTVEIEKRTEANLGTVRFEGMTFSGGAGLLAPPAHASRRIEFLSDSTIDGFGVEGDRNVTCINTAPPQYDNERKSMSFFTASGLNAEMVLNAYSGKGIQLNEDPMDTDYFPVIYPRTLPEMMGSSWNFSVNVPDAMVVSLGGADLDGLNTAPAGFQTAYDNFVSTIRSHYPNAYLWLTVWSQIKDDVTTTRTAMKNVLNAIVTARAGAGDNKIFMYVFPEANVDTDETGCFYHANAAHHQAMANLMITEIKSKTGW